MALRLPKDYDAGFVEQQLRAEITRLEGEIHKSKTLNLSTVFARVPGSNHEENEMRLHIQPDGTVSILVRYQGRTYSADLTEKT